MSSDEKKQTFREVLATNDIVLAPGAYDVVSARIIRESGAPIVYLSGLANEASDLGLPDLGFTTAVEMVRRAGLIARAVDCPVVSDADTGFGGPINVVRTVREFAAAGVSAIHLEDQSFPKRCGLLAGKSVVAAEAFAATVRTAVDAAGPGLTIIARSDAKGAEGVDGVITRLKRYADAGAGAVMLGDFYTAEDYERIARAVPVPLIACAADPHNFAVQPDFSRDAWRAMGVRMVVYWHLPLFAAMKAVREAVTHLATHGSLSMPALATDGYRDYARTVDLDRWLAVADRSEGTS
jgi:2-methylisocitrate lyase-like PEP mutase family enzyme